MNQKLVRLENIRQYLCKILEADINDTVWTLQATQRLQAR
jgi:hypothetical protein